MTSSSIGMKVLNENSNTLTRYLLMEDVWKIPDNFLLFNLHL